MGNRVIKIIDIIIVVATFLMAFSSCFYLYVTKSELQPTGVTSTYATQMTDPQTGKEYSAIETNYYSNVNNTGYEVIELLFNCYSGISKQSIYSRGYQLVFDNNGKVVPYVDPTTNESSNVWQLNRNSSGQSFMTGHTYNMDDPMIIDIDGKTYAVKLDGTYNIHHREFDGWKLARSIGFLGLNFIFEDTNMYNEYTTTHDYTFEDLLLKIRQIIKSSSTGTGQSTIALMDLGDFLHIYDVNEDGQISAEPLGAGTLTNSYFTMDTHYSTRGMQFAEQSLFNSVAGNNKFNISGISANIDYWQTKTVYTITEQSMTHRRYVASEDGYYFGLSEEFINELKDYNNVIFNVDFNLSNFKDIKILGFDNYALYGIEINELKISSDNLQNFNLLVGSLKDTGIDATEIITNNVNIIDLYPEVSL